LFCRAIDSGEGGQRQERMNPDAIQQLTLTCVPSAVCSPQTRRCPFSDESRGFTSFVSLNGDHSLDSIAYYDTRMSDTFVNRELQSSHIVLPRPWSWYRHLSATHEADGVTNLLQQQERPRKYDDHMFLTHLSLY
jgi:hypothetical protein